MTEKGLKTLKDMEHEEIDEDGILDRIFFKDRLREEALKWIEELNKEIDERVNYKHSLPQTDSGSSFSITDAVYLSNKNGRIEWIKHFFNLEG